MIVTAEAVTAKDRLCQDSMRRIATANVAFVKVASAMAVAAMIVNAEAVWKPAKYCVNFCRRCSFANTHRSANLWA
jgi:hypothetical protein